MGVATRELITSPQPMLNAYKADDRRTAAPGWVYYEKQTGLRVEIYQPSWSEAAGRPNVWKPADTAVIPTEACVRYLRRMGYTVIDE